jgi:hypothetical protein
LEGLHTEVSSPDHDIRTGSSAHTIGLVIEIRAAKSIPNFHAPNYVVFGRKAKRCMVKRFTFETHHRPGTMGRQMGARFDGLTAILVTWSLFPPVAYSESVEVKYRGKIELLTYECRDILRSSFIYRVCYDADKSSMIIKLNDAYYEYCGISVEIVEGLLNAESMGRYYNGVIKSSATGGRFDCRNF